MSTNNNVIKKDILLLERILKGGLRGHYGIPKSQVRIDLVIICAEFDLEYHMLSQAAPAYKANRWYKKINGHVEEWATADYLQYLSDNIRDKNNDKGTNKDAGAQSLATKARYAIRVLRQILDGINFDSGGQYTYRKHQTPNKERRENVLMPLPAGGKGKSKGFCAYSYRKSFSIEPYLVLYLENIRRDVVIKTVQSAQYTISNNSKQIVGLTNEGTMRAMRTLTANLFENTINISNNQYITPQEIKDKIGVVRSMLRQAEEQLEIDFVKQSLNSQLERINNMCSEKQSGWVKRSYILFKRLLQDYGQIDPTTHISLLVNFAEFLELNRTNEEFRTQNINNKDWLDDICEIYEEAIRISEKSIVIEDKIKILIDYAFFAHNNNRYDKFKNICDIFFEMYATEGEKYPTIYIPNLAWMLHAYGMVHYCIDNFQDAFEFFLWSRDLTKSLLQFDDAYANNYIISSSYMADILIEENKFDCAHEIFREAEEMYIKYSRHWTKNEHCSYASVLNKHSLLFKKQNNLQEAKSKLQEAIDLYDKIFKGKYKNCQHYILDNIASAYCNMGNICLDLNDYEFGKKCFCKSLLLLDILVGYSSDLYEEELVLTRADFIELLCESSDTRTAIKEVEKNISYYMHKYDKNNIDTIRPLVRNFHRLAHLYTDTSQHEFAIKAYKDAEKYIKQMERKEPGCLLEALSITYGNMMALYQALEMQYEADTMLKQTICVLEEISKQTGKPLKDLVEKWGEDCII